MGYRNKAALDDTDKVYRRWARKLLKNGELVGWIVEVSKKPVASGCIWLKPVPPLPGYEGGPQPYLLSMYTEPEFRGKGLAKKIVLESLRWAKKQGFFRMTLHTSDMGKSIYEKLGFERTWEMKKEFRSQRARRLG